MITILIGVYNVIYWLGFVQIQELIKKDFCQYVIILRIIDNLCKLQNFPKIKRNKI